MNDSKLIKARIKDFRLTLKDKAVSEIRIVRKYIIFGTPYIFSSNETLYFDLKEEVSDFFRTYPSSVIMTGSTKLGFSLKPGQLWQPVGPDSDIDIAIIDKSLFNEYWKGLFDINIKITFRSEQEEKRYFAFLSYFFRGWLRPDLFPFSYPKRAELFNFTTSMYNKYDNRKVSVAMFHSRYFFEHYHASNIKHIREKYEQKKHWNFKR